MNERKAERKEWEKKMEAREGEMGKEGEREARKARKYLRNWMIYSHRRKLLLGPGAQAPPHFYDHGARLYDEPPTFVT